MLDYISYNAARQGIPARTPRRSIAEAMKRHSLPTVRETRSEWVINREGFTS